MGKRYGEIEHMAGKKVFATVACLKR